VNLCDANVWLALALSDHVHQPQARAGFEQVTAPDTVLFCRATQQAFLRILTDATVLGAYGNPPLTNSEAWAAYDALMAGDRVGFLVAEPPGQESRWKAFAVRDTASPKLCMDAFLAAFALEAGLRLVTTDRAFHQFPGLDVLSLI
jgi:toxin-antitoxin system PIN domain toxin